METFIQHIEECTTRRDGLQARYEQKIKDGADPESDEMRHHAQTIQGLTDGIVRDTANLSTMRPAPSIEERALALATEERERVEVEALAAKILDPDIDTSEIERPREKK